MIPTQEPTGPRRRSVLTGMAAGAALSVLAQPAYAQNRRPPQATRQRDRELLGEGWRHMLGDPAGAQQPGLDAAVWQPVSIPHTWNAEDSLDDTPGFYRGPGWYRRSVKMTGALKKKRVFLYFEGAFQVADVYVDGERVGGHVGGYTAFSVEITDQLRRVGPGKDAVVAVRVDNTHMDDVPPYSGDWTYYGGLYRNVWLVATDEVHLDVLDHASPGVRVDTPVATASQATVRVRGRVVNDSARAETAQVRATVLDADGRTVVEARTEVRLGAGTAGEFELRLPAIVRPHLWSPESPYLYQVATVVDSGQGGRDRVDSPLGVRWFSADPATGFSLNGQAYPLRGTNRHQDIVGRGNALTDADHIRDLEIIKAMGANVIRLAHYPQAPAVLEAADELGLLLWEEAPMVNRATMTQAFVDNHLNNIRDMVRQHHNHPSIVVWGTMNEILLRLPSPQPAGYVEFIHDMLRQGDELVRAEDATRLTAMVGHQAALYNTSGIADIPMVWGWNLYHGWYGGKAEQFGPYLDAEHAAHPERVLWISEFGADSDPRLHRVVPGDLPRLAGYANYQDQSIEFQQYYLESYLRQIDERPWLAGTTYWSQFDFGSESRTGSVPHVNTKGLMLSDRTPKPVYHLMQAWRGVDVLHIATDLWDHRAGIGPDGAAGYQPVEQTVTVYSNAAEVELFLGGVSLGVRPTDSIGYAAWMVPFVHGTNVLSATATSPSGDRLSDEAIVDFTYHAPLLADPEVPFERLAVSTGAIVQYTDPDGTVWVEDREYTPGAWGAVAPDFTAGYGWMKNNWVNGSDEDPLYQTYRKGMSAYRFDVPDGAYEVTLRMAEITSVGDVGGDGYAVPAPDGTVQVPVGWRIFDVAVNGAPVETGLDLVAKVGQHTPYDVTTTVTAAGGAGIEIAFAPVKNLPVVSAIDVRRTA
ncbi:glycoside hydrolase family 2 TIM barrel-domain containing protein [Georgenia sp. SYP-B2076]|uniref:glycoside hydrolase family 2 TIM barrel-domain containing protein n=1 Tax=Georgenia sp. SYP-B2076 TaxID=2495881 RepID=UPI0013E057B4|nr:glycoside hydrolase family 2 TIM barrel-domain containing protein [Georgenia sp. SYP-B2076]